MNIQPHCLTYVHSKGSRRTCTWRSRLAAATVGVIAAAAAAVPPDNYVVLGANDLGMHCMQSDYSQMMLLPPFNNLRAQVLRRGGEPRLVTSGVTISYQIQGNTHSSDKTNFWTYEQQLLGTTIAPDVGLKGFGLAGEMRADSSHRSFIAEGVPVTPIDDDGKENAYPLALITVRNAGTILTQTQAVIPVSWEISCNLCHNTPGKTAATDLLEAHDRLHATQLVSHQPVMCASCHSDNALAAPGKPGVSSLSSAMHSSHATRMQQAGLENSCYACHPGIRTTCQRDVHSARGMTCTTCHTSMEAVGNPTRRPWVDMPRCDSCHQRAGFEFEQPGKLFRDSTGHGGVQCISCHSSPHAIGPARTAADNAQATRLQGHSGVIDTCIVCHTSTPDEGFWHRSHE